jgi:hypothetical protein
MHMITVSFGSSSCPLLFKTKEAAEAAWEAITTLRFSPVESGSMESMRQPNAQYATRVTDDFGRQVCIWNLNGAIMEDMAVAQEGQIEVGLHQARTQVKANQRGQNDPTLRASQLAQGPAMINPGLNGNGRMF